MTYYNGKFGCGWEFCFRLVIIGRRVYIEIGYGPGYIELEWKGK